ncbi:MAG: hypothetical protein M1825_000676 [Sarcosagium campestre]|nr:MAG: hypothetical protein M1825_000676 [Sarcosagium campestre]
MVAITELSGSPSTALGFSVVHQKLELEIDFTGRTVAGKTEITINPLVKDLRTIRLNCRQATLKRLNIDGKAPTVNYQEPYARFKVHSQATVHQYHQLRQKLGPQLKEPPEEELVLQLPKSISVTELDSLPSDLQNAALARSVGLGRGEVSELPTSASTPTSRMVDDRAARFKPLTVYIEYLIENFRDGLHFVGCEEGDLRYPHAYTTNSIFPGSSCSLFPCVDEPSSRCTWEIVIRCPRTLGDALRCPKDLDDSQAKSDDQSHQKPLANLSDDSAVSGGSQGSKTNAAQEEDTSEMSVICSGDLTDEIVDPTDPTKKTVSFFCSTAVAPHHIGFAIGPFEHVDLSEFRDSDTDDKLGQNATPVHGFCLPGRVRELKNSCFPMAKALDFFTLSYGSYPFTSFKMCFVDDLVQDTVELMSLSLCSNRLLFPEDILDPIDRSTQKLVHTLACQWVGVNIIPKEQTDIWLIVGTSHFITDLFLRKLCGNNEYRFNQKRNADRVFDLDIDRPSIFEIGASLSLDDSQMEFIALKASLVLFILDRRLTKAGGSSGLARIISRIFLNAKVGDLPNGALTTGQFFRTCEKLGHAKLDTFFQQWVYGAGCPRFYVTQRFNKKKSVVEMLIKQTQSERPDAQLLTVQNFMRDVKEDMYNVDAGEMQAAFSGPMTIRIHEADGTPYEHIVEIKDAMTKFEIPYNTKYKRLKRSRRQKERSAAAAGVDTSADAQDDVLLYCLGDVLQSEDEVREWQLTDWTKEDEDRMNQESYEWIRMDADFEWIGKMTIVMPGYMYLSQLQQDRDVVAQYESIQYISAQKESPLISTILLRTLMDRRYFHGIRLAAARGLAKCATEELGWIGLTHLEMAFKEFFCFPDSSMTRSNDFSDRTSYAVQCTIPQAMAEVRDANGDAPVRVTQFLLDLLKFNDNANNEFSDCHYNAAVMLALTKTLVRANKEELRRFSMVMVASSNGAIYQAALNEIDRYRLMDEWISSYQNVLTTTALRCKEALVAAKFIPLRVFDFLQYTSEANFDQVRLQALHSLVSLGLLRDNTVLKFFLYVLHSDPSPYVRRNLQSYFEQGLAAVAIGDNRPGSVKPRLDDLVIEQDVEMGSRQLEADRRQTIPGALTALEADLSENEVLKKALWEAVTSPRIGLYQMRDLLDICHLLYKPVTSMMVKLDYPKFWEVDNLGQGKLRFRRARRHRLRPMPSIQLPSSPQATDKDDSTAEPGPTTTKINFKQKRPGTGVLPSSASFTTPQPEPAKPKLTLKIKFSGAGGAGSP